MHIFIDETGSFSGIGKFPSPSLVGALVVADRKLSVIERRYQKLRASFPQDKGDVKGRLLNERQVNSVVEMLRRNEAIFEATMVDLGIHTRDGILAHKAGQERGITVHITEEHHANVKASLWDLRRQLEHMSLPLYIQSVVTFDLIYRVIQHGTLFFSQRRPEELGRFVWVIDAKGSGDQSTPWEDWWSFVVMPALQSRSLREPMGSLVGGDYSYFERFRTTTPEYLKAFRAEPRTDDASAVDLRPVLTENFRFSSKSELGLELVDIVTNGVRRALVGNLKFEGWQRIPQLMIHRSQHYIDLVSLMTSLPEKRTYPYKGVLNHFKKGGRNMLAPRFQD